MNAYIFKGIVNSERQGGNLTESGLRKLSFFLLIALIFYVAITGGT